MGATAEFDPQILDVIGSIYDSAIDPDNWPTTLERICRYTGASCGSITLIAPGERRVRILQQWGAPDEFVALMHASADINPVISSWLYYDLDEPFTSVDYMGRDEWLACKFYQERIKPFGYFDCVLSAVAKSFDRSGAIALPFTQSDAETPRSIATRLLPLCPHIRRAVKISDLLEMQRLSRDALASTLDLISVGIVLVDRHGRIAHANRAGHALLADGGTLRRQGNHIATREPKSAALMLQAIAQAAASRADLLAPGGSSVSLPGPGGRDLAAWVLPLDNALSQELSTSYGAEVAIFVKELGDTSAFPAELFVKHYGITPAECRVLTTMVQGMTVSGTSETLGISEATVKTHLARLFAKTGTTGQPDLMRLAVSALAPAGSP